MITCDWSKGNNDGCHQSDVDAKDCQQEATQFFLASLAGVLRAYRARCEDHPLQHHSYESAVVFTEIDFGTYLAGFVMES